MSRTILYITMFLFSFFVYAQSDKDVDQQNVYNAIVLHDEIKVESIINSKFLKSVNKSKKVIGNVYLAFFYSLEENADNKNKMIKALINAKNIAIETENPLDMAYVDYGYALYYLVMKKPEQFIISFNKSLKIFKQHPEENFIITLLYDAKKTYRWEAPFEKEDSSLELISNEYAKKSNNSLLIYSTYYDFARFYERQFSMTGNTKYLDLMEQYLRKSYQYAERIKDPKVRQKVTITYNISYGMLMTHKKDFSQALDFYNKGLKLNGGDFNGAISFIIYTNIGEVYLGMNKINTALEYYTKAFDMVENNNDKIPAFATTYKMVIYRAAAYKRVSELYEKLNQPEKALLYTKKAYALTEKEIQNQYDSNIKSLQVFYKTEEERILLEEKNKNYSKYKLLYISIIALAIITIIFLFFILRYRQKLNKERISLLESEKARVKAEQKLLEAQQEHLQKQILAKSLQLDYKTAFIKDLRDKIDNDRNLNIGNILKKEQLTDNDFNSLQNIIQETHPNFFKRLNDVSKNKLTNLDMKYAAYIYLNMDNIQIANILKVDPKTVSITKYRLKQKLGLEKGEDLQIFIRNLET